MNKRNWLSNKPLSKWKGIKVIENCDNDFIVKSIEFQNNFLFGRLPKLIGNLINLQELVLINNKYLTGKIPLEIFKLNNLKVLDLFNNYFLGCIPKEIEKLKNLEILNLSSNKLKGEIPLIVFFLLSPKSISLTLSGTFLFG